MSYDSFLRSWMGIDIRPDSPDRKLTANRSPSFIFSCVLSVLSCQTAN